MALCDEVITAALARIGEDWTCAPLDNGWLLVTTSHQYSDGDHVELLMRRDRDTVEISDGGDALARLDLAGVNVERGRAKDMWHRLLRAHEVEAHDERLSIQGAVSDLGWLAENMANAVANLDGIRLLVASPRSPMFADTLTTLFKAEFEYVQENPQVRGRSGGIYRATARLGDRQNPTLVQAVAGESTQTRQRALEHAFTMFSDVNGQLPIERKLAVLSDADWRAEQINLLSNVAYVGAWPYRDEFLGFLTSESYHGSHILMPVQGEMSDG
ncbi:MAG: DUF1828 domain-containing protein [Candidatus Dormibacteria bacterium]